MADHSDPGGSRPDDKSGSGEQGAVTPEQLASIKSSILQEVNRTMDGALSSRLGRLEGQLTERLDSLAGQLESAGKKKPDDKDKPPAKSNTDTEVESLRKDLAAERNLRTTNERHAAIRSALNAKDEAGRAICRDPELALSLLKDREDISRTEAGEWVGKVKGELGDPVQASLSQVVSSLLQQHKVLAPATATGGAGSQGSGGSGGSGAPAGDGGAPSLEEYGRMSPEQKTAVSEQLFGPATKKTEGFGW